MENAWNYNPIYDDEFTEEQKKYVYFKNCYDFH